ncbi:MAG: alpha-ketoacid dehydrogenase subunit beta [Kordiimonadaceae bacterium]|nr:alpha-ketoacid dehydrogenase subunit beta [Kordiimonadaceae bacterium]
MSKLSISKALNLALHQMMAADETVIIIGEDIVGGAGTEGGDALGGAFGVTSGLAAQFGKSRVIDTPISETAFMGMAIGAAASGLKPVVEVMFCDFMGVCFDQILNQAAKMRFLSDGQVSLPLVIRTSMGAGDSSGAMHSQSLHGLLASIPGLRVVCPSNAADAAGLLKSALADPNPVVMLEHKGLYDAESEVDASLPAVPLGQGKIVLEGDAVTIVAVSAMVPVASKAAQELAGEGIKVEVIDPRSIAPLDTDLITTSLQKTGRLIVVDEGAAYGGFADMVIAEMARSAFQHFKAAPIKITPPHTPVPYAPSLESDWLPATGDITKAVRELLHG